VGEVTVPYLCTTCRAGFGGGWGDITCVLLVGLALGDGWLVAGEDTGDKLCSFLQKTEDIITTGGSHSFNESCDDYGSHTVYSLFHL
jgi:hypothetical protein